MDVPNAKSGPNRRRAFTLAEVVISMVIVATVFSGITLAYIQSARRAEWTGRSLAAQSLCIQQIEQARAARWDFVTPVDEVVNMNLIDFSSSGGVIRGHTWANLDLPSSGTNFVRATNYVTITDTTLPTGATVRMIQVDTVWPFEWQNETRYFTTTTCTYRAPDQ